MLQNKNNIAVSKRFSNCGERETSYQRKKYQVLENLALHKMTLALYIKSDSKTSSIIV